MANNAKYTPSYSFVGFQTNNPTKPLPAARIDEQFYDISYAINLNADNLAQIRRSDGGLQNGIVGRDQLSPALSIGFRLRGDWKVDQIYDTGDGVVLNGVFYSANEQHVSTALNAPEQSGSKWTYLFAIADIVVDGLLQMPVDVFVGDGNITRFPLTFAPLSKNNLIVVVGGIQQPVSSYEIEGSNVVLNEPVPDGYDLEVRGFTTTAAYAADGSIETYMLKDGVVTRVKLADEAVSHEKLAQSVRDDIESRAKQTTRIIAGSGLTGTGDLSADVTLALTSGALASLALADTALQDADITDLASKAELSAGLAGKLDKTAQAVDSALLEGKTAAQVIAGLATDADLTTGLAGKLDKTAKAADSALLNGQNAAQIIAGLATESDLTSGLGGKLDKTAKAADSALLNGQTAAQITAGLAKTADLGALAVKDVVAVGDIQATGVANAATVLYGNGTWRIPSGGSGGMDPLVYDPNNHATDAFDMGNMTETAAAKIMTAAERTAIAANTGARHTHSNKSVLDAVTAAYTTAEKTKLAGIPADADATTETAVSNALKGTSLATAIDETNDRLFILDVGANIPSRRTGWSTVKNWIKGWISKADVGLTNVDNTSDAAKPISTATQNALNGKLNTNGKAADSSLLNGQTAAQLPVSNATTTALNAKFDKSGGTITNDVTLSKNGAPLTLNSLSARANTSAGSTNTGGFLSSQIGVDIIASFYAFEQVGSHTQATISLSPGGGLPNTFLTFRNNGSLQVPGALSKGSGTFLIDHPLDPLNKNLRHGFVEAPEYLNIYRGVVDLEAGRMAVDIDAAFGMTDGTFAALNVEVCVFVQTQYSPEKVWIEAPADSGKFTIVSENAQSNATVAFMVTGRRNDAFVRSSLDPNTDSEGRFIPEYEKED